MYKFVFLLFAFSPWIHATQITVHFTSPTTKRCQLWLAPEKNGDYNYNVSVVGFPGAGRTLEALRRWGGGEDFPLGRGFSISVAGAVHFAKNEGLLLHGLTSRDATELQTLSLVNEFLNGLRRGRMINLQYALLAREDSEEMHGNDLILIVPDDGQGGKNGLLVALNLVSPAHLFLYNRDFSGTKGFLTHARIQGLRPPYGFEKLPMTPEQRFAPEVFPTPDLRYPSLK